MVFDSPLRYPGGKGKLTNFFKLLVEENNLFDGHYAEPYAGGASVALSLLFQEYVNHIYINDINKSIYAFWYSALNHTDELLKMIKDRRVSVAEWKRQKAIQKDSKDSSVCELGFSTFFLNRTNRSGIIDNGGIIGGNKQTGKWKIDARYNKEELIRRITKIAHKKSSISLSNIDAKIFVDVGLSKLPEKTLVYFDPPYYYNGKKLYENHYKENDHAVIASSISKIKKKKWVVTYDNVPEICDLYKGFRQQKYGLNYSVSKYYQGSEVIIYCDEMSIPHIEDPVSIK